MSSANTEKFDNKKFDFDVVVIGGGIIGAGCALEASLRGAKVLLLEKKDFGSETSSGSFKIIHGGLRYLQHLDFRRLKESVDAQRYLRSKAPHLLKTLPFIVPCYGKGKKSKLLLDLACTAYDYLSKDRNNGVKQDLQLPNHTILKKEELLKIAPHLNPNKLTGGVVFYDCQMTNPDRLLLSVVRAAEDAGAIVRNYSEVTSVQVDKTTNEISKIKILDTRANISYNISPKCVINATGPWTYKFSELLDPNIQLEKPTLSYSKGVQVIIPKLINDYAISVESNGKDSAATLNRGNRAFFIQPWHNYSLLGTTDTIFKGSPDSFSINLEDLKQFIKEVHDAYPSPLIKPANVRYTFGGLRIIDNKIKQKIDSGVLEKSKRDGMNNTSRSEDIIDHADFNNCWGIPKIKNLVSVIGIKYTTFRNVSETVCDILSKKKLLSEKSLSKDTYLRGGQTENVSEILKKEALGYFPQDMLDNITKDLLSNYGSDAPFLFRKIIEKKPKTEEELSFLIEQTKINYAVNFEYAKTLSDIVKRRLSNGAFGFPGHMELKRIGLHAKIALGLSEENYEEQVAEIIKEYSFNSN